jgi:hypothetical protein
MQRFFNRRITRSELPHEVDAQHCLSSKWPLSSLALGAYGVTNLIHLAKEFALTRELDVNTNPNCLVHSHTVAAVRHSSRTIYANTP